MTYGYGMAADVWLRCKGTTNARTRCKRTNLGPYGSHWYCWQHEYQERPYV